MKPTRRRAKPEEEDNRDRWLVSYADLLTLLFAFFVVMYAISSLDVRKWERVSIGMKAAFADPLTEKQPVLTGVFSGGTRGGRKGSATGDRPGSGEAAWELLLLRDHIAANLAESGMEGDEADDPVRISLSERGLLLSLASDAFFAAGTARLEASGLPMLDELGRALATTQAQIRIEAHTDERPPASSRYASGWELSSGRAGAVARHLINRQRIQASRIGVAGFVGGQALGRSDGVQALEQRVDIVVLGGRDSWLDASSEAKEQALQGLLNQLQPIDEP